MKKIAIILLTSAALSGCASIIKGGSQNIDITTNNGQSVNATIFTKKLIFHKQSPYKKIVKTLQLQLKKDDAIKNP